MQMDNSDSTKLKDILSAIDPVEFKWDDTNTTVGIIAQEINSIDISDYAITSNTGLTVGHASVASSNSWANGSSISFASSTNPNTFRADTTEYSKSTIKTAKSTIDIDELAEMMETLKRRLLILIPAFEKHEKYPMLKQMYDEYKAMEALLSGPASNE